MVYASLQVHRTHTNTNSNCADLIVVIQLNGVHFVYISHNHKLPNALNALNAISQQMQQSFCASSFYARTHICVGDGEESQKELLTINHNPFIRIQTETQNNIKQIKVFVGHFV